MIFCDRWFHRDIALLFLLLINRLKQKHYENMPIQIYRKFHLQTLKFFRYKNSDILYISAQNIDCGHSLEAPRRGGSNGYPQSMFLGRNKKKEKMYIKVGFNGDKII